MTVPLSAKRHDPRTTADLVWPCLMYHEIVPGIPAGAAQYYAVAAGRFAEQMRALEERGLRGVSLEEQLRDPAADGVAITFDDGHESAYIQAFPEMLRRGMHATFFITTSWVGQPGRVTWDQLREMAAAGMSLQSHTATHPFLSELTRSTAGAELANSRLRLDEELGQHTTTISLPGGDFPPGGAALCVAAGYRWVATSRWGPNQTQAESGQTPPLVRRYTVRAGTTDAQFLRLIMARSSASSPEALRLRALSDLRSLMGAQRYARWRKRFLHLWSAATH
jgi:peptidoglycan/xylan/chitin deacetylase (PgdA/CDA1 family)